MGLAPSRALLPRGVARGTRTAGGARADARATHRAARVIANGTCNARDKGTHLMHENMKKLIHPYLKPKLTIHTNGSTYLYGIPFLRARGTVNPNYRSSCTARATPICLSRWDCSHDHAATMESASAPRRAVTGTAENGGVSPATPWRVAGSARGRSGRLSYASTYHMARDSQVLRAV